MASLASLFVSNLNVHFIRFFGQPLEAGFFKCLPPMVGLDPGFLDGLFIACLVVRFLVGFWGEVSASQE